MSEYTSEHAARDGGAIAIETDHGSLVLNSSTHSRDIPGISSHETGTISSSSSTNVHQVPTSELCTLARNPDLVSNTADQATGILTASSTTGRESMVELFSNGNPTFRELVRNISRHHSSISSNEQRQVNEYINALMWHYLQARCLLPNDFLDILLQLPHRDGHTQSRRLNDAAIRQNERRRCEVWQGLHIRNLISLGVGVTSVHSTQEPILYSDTFDDLIGTRWPADRGVIDYTSTTSRARVHNGLRFQRGHLHITANNRYLIGVRQARALAGLSTTTLDEEITYRSICGWDGWGWLGTLMHQSDWTRTMRCFCEAVGCATRGSEFRAGFNDTEGGR